MRGVLLTMEQLIVATNAPLINIIAIGIIAIIIIILVPTMAIFLKKKAGITKIGPVDFESLQKKGYDHLDHVISCQHYMDDEIHDIDDLLHQHCYETVESIELHITNILRPMLTHGLLIESVVSRLSLIFTSGIIRNHFTREFSKQEHYDRYRKRIMEKIKDHYCDFYERIRITEMKIATWNELETKFHEIVDYWLLNVRDHVTQACREKIEVYERYKTRFKNDQHRLDICSECIEKNQQYITSIASL
jgi:hypothetical protein